MSVTGRRIVGGIEFYAFEHASGEVENACQCARCGSSCGWVNCANCSGEGEIDDSDNWAWPRIYRCDWCQGRAGSWHCIASLQWCTENPMPGRETIESTAYSAAGAWDE